ncbi:LysR family transcriptional regulator [Pseudomonas sp. NPDC089422]|uniref:LysR family transcriptional regulator n=1 Tax=Pseudomonas sp. NPDC089422 TaxID=3364466 RepID=UPI003820B0C4
MKISSFSEVEAFLTVAELMSFGQAARELGIAQSTVSRRITNLEARLGHQLVLRTTRKVALTDAGQSYAADLREVVTRLEAADSKLQSGLLSAEGLLRVTMPTAFGRAYVLPRLARLSKYYPRLRFEVDLSDRYVDLLDGEFDVAIRLASPAQSGVRYVKLMSFKPVLCASPSYLAQHDCVSELAGLTKHVWLAQRVYAPALNFQVSWQGTRTNLEIKPRISVSDATSLRTLTLNGAGLAVLPCYLVEKQLQRGDLVEVLPGLEFDEFEVFVAFLRHREQSTKVKVLLDALRA